MDFGKKTTWYQNSLRTNEYTMTNSGDNKLYTSAYPNWIDIETLTFTAAHRYVRKLGDDSYGLGGVLNKDGTFSTRESFYPIVLKNGQEVSSADYTISYTDGTVTFTQENSSEDIIKASFNYANPTRASEFIVHPPAERLWAVEHTEIQFSKSVAAPMPTVVFQLWGGKSDYSYNYSDPADYSQYCLYEQHFRSPADYINIGNEGKGVIPAFGGFSSDMIVFPFNYLNSICLGNVGPAGSTLRIYIVDDSVFQNVDMATLAVYIEDRPTITYA